MRPHAGHRMKGVNSRAADLLDDLQRASFRYFWQFADPATGLVPDTDRPGAPCSISAVGMALACYPVGAERGFVGRAEAAERARRTLATLRDGPEGDPERLGRNGFFWHFIDMRDGRRWPRSEVSTIDTAILFAGALMAAQYFGRDDPVERAAREAAEAIVERADWRWALARGSAVSHGWRPRRFLRYRWTGYSEALILYVLGLGSASSPLPREAYGAWTSTYSWKRVYGIEHLYAGPLFIHQLSHLWIDFRGIRDEAMRAAGTDYFENSRRATLVQQLYAIHNPRGFEGYGERGWGITAGMGPGPAMRRVKGRRIWFHGYKDRGVPWGPDDGTLSPWGVVASLPFAPEIAAPTLLDFTHRYPKSVCPHGYRRSVNPTFPTPGGAWVAEESVGIEQGPVVLAIENHRSGLPWRLMSRCPTIIQGLRRAGFRGGWLRRSSAAS